MGHIEFENVSKSYGAVKVIEDFTLSMDRGELVVFVGPSGCGKSTLLRLLAGLEDIGGGDIRIAGRSVVSKQPKDRNVAMVFQNYALYPHMTVAENIAFAMKIQKKPKQEIRAAVEKTAAILGLEEVLTRRPKQLSGGQRQRVAMGRAIVRDPQVFLMDEPLSNLDAKLRNQMRVEIKQLQQRLGATMIYVTHDQVEAMTLADKIVILKGGRIQQAGTPEAVYQQPANAFVADFIGSPPMNFIRATRHGDKALRLAEGMVLHLPAAALKQLDRQTCLVGVRPENIVFEPSPDALPQGAFVWRSNIRLRESLGGEALLHIQLADQDIRLKLHGRQSCKTGDAVRVGFAPESVHLFCEKDGTCLSHGSEASSRTGSRF